MRIKEIREKIGRPRVIAWSSNEVIFVDKNGKTNSMSRSNFLLLFPELEYEITFPIHYNSYGRDGQ